MPFTRSWKTGEFWIVITILLVALTIALAVCYRNGALAAANCSAVRWMLFGGTGHSVGRSIMKGLSARPLEVAGDATEANLRSALSERFLGRRVESSLTAAG